MVTHKHVTEEVKNRCVTHHSMVLGWYSDLGIILREVGWQSLAQVDFKIETFDIRIEHSFIQSQ